ncbi:MAG TPA: pilus assembly protein TadG-related protein, partial [Actinomycetes bacterium]
MRERDDGGYVAILVAIALPLFMTLAALAVDVANWYAQAQRVQQAADAAALAGSVYLPLDPAYA